MSNFSDRVEPLGMPNNARQLTAGASSSNTALGDNVSRISMRAVSADIRFVIGPGPQTASATTSHFIGKNERLDFAVPSGANIAIIRDSSTDGTLELTELA